MVTGVTPGSLSTCFSRGSLTTRRLKHQESIILSLVNDSASSSVIKMEGESTLPTLTLLQAHVFFRHGDRTPTKLEASSLQDDDLWIPLIQPHPDLLLKRSHSKGTRYPYAQLTKLGAKQAEQLGTDLAEIYSRMLHLFSEDGCLNSFANVSLRTTDFPRTYYSGFFVLKGFLKSAIDLSSFPIAIKSSESENLYNNDSSGRGKSLWSKLWSEVSGPHPKQWRTTFEVFKKELTDFLNISHMEKFPWVIVADNCFCRLNNGFPVPQSASKAAVDSIRNLLAMDHSLVFQSQESCQLAMGPLLDEVTSEMMNSMEGRSNLKLALYSGHDTTLFPLMAALGIPLTYWPAYSSCLRIELWRSNDSSAEVQYFIRVWFQNEAVCLPLEPPPVGKSWADLGPWQQAGDVLCPWPRFLAIADWIRKPVENLQIQGSL